MNYLQNPLCSLGLRGSKKISLSQPIKGILTRDFPIMDSSGMSFSISNWPELWSPFVEIWFRVIINTLIIKNWIRMRMNCAGNNESQISSEKYRGYSFFIFNGVFHCRSNIWLKLMDSKRKMINEVFKSLLIQKLILTFFETPQLFLTKFRIL